jgi:hypothetical protein
LIICSITSETVSVKVGGVHYDTISDSGNDSETAKQDGDEQGVEENEEAVAEGCGQHAAQPAHEITAKKSGIHEKDDRNTDGAASEGEANEAEPDETERVNTRFFMYTKVYSVRHQASSKQRQNPNGRVLNLGLSICLTSTRKPSRRMCSGYTVTRSLSRLFLRALTTMIIHNTTIHVCTHLLCLTFSARSSSIRRTKMRSSPC